MPRPFLKMHGLGNDFVIIDSRADGFVPALELRLKMADRHRGIGYDQMVVLHKPKSPEADVFMTIANADGSETGACGNVTRCVAKLLFQETGKSNVVIQTAAGLLKASKQADGLIAVDMGPARLEWNEIPLAQNVDTLNVPMEVDGYKNPCCVNMGNPHAVFFVPEAEAVPLDKVGPKLEHHPMFPERCNIEFAHIIDSTHIRMRVWERGTGITQACGTGACATLVAAVRLGLTNRRAEIILDGGTLTIEWRESDGHVIIAGPATLVFRGELSEL